MKKWLDPLSNAWEGIRTHKLPPVSKPSGQTLFSSALERLAALGVSGVLAAVPKPSLKKMRRQ